MTRHRFHAIALYVILSVFLLARIVGAQFTALVGDNSRIEFAQIERPTCYAAGDWIGHIVTRYIHAPEDIPVC